MVAFNQPIFDGDPRYDGGDDPIILRPGQPVEVIPTPTPTPTPTPAPTPSPAPVTSTGTGSVMVLPPPPTPRRARTSLPIPVVAGLPRYAAADYARAASALLPRGFAWSTDPDSAQQATLRGIGKAFERSDARLSGVLAGSLPGSATALLPEWEASLGLPDPCLGGTPTVDQRLNQVRGRFVGTGGQSRQHYIDFADALGFAITIAVYKPGQSNLPPIGLAPDSPAWAFLWGVTVIATTGSLPVDVLRCELEVAKPAETTLILLDGPAFATLRAETDAPLRSENYNPILSE